VYAYAVQYITVRSWGILAAMLGFVASGTYRWAALLAAVQHDWVRITGCNAA
jgi:hypothetical protein